MNAQATGAITTPADYSELGALFITVALLGTAQVSAATLYGFVDVLAGTRRDWQMLHGEPAPRSLFRPLVVSREFGVGQIAPGGQP